MRGLLRASLSSCSAESSQIFCRAPKAPCNYILTKVSVVPYEQFINKQNKKLGVKSPLRTGIVKAKLRVRKFSDKFP